MSSRAILLAALLATVAIAQNCGYNQFESNGKCQVCLANCLICRNSFECLQCNNGYNIDSNSTKCVKPQVFSVVGIITIVVFSVLFCMFIFSVFLSIITRARFRRMHRTVELVVIQPVVNPELLQKFNQEVIYFDRANDECSICLEPETNVITICHHNFHFNCLKEWTKHQESCPNCKGYCAYLKSRCPSCLQFTRPLKMCAQNCQSSDHFSCIWQQISGQCQNCPKMVSETQEPIGSQQRLAPPPVIISQA